MAQYVKLDEEYKQNLVKSWDSVINVDGLNDIKNNEMKTQLAQVLENTYGELRKSGFSARKLNEAFDINVETSRGGAENEFSGSQQDWKAGDVRIPLATIPLARRMFTQLLAHEIVGVQSMAAPTGYAAAYRYVYGSGDNAGEEVIWGKFDPSFSGTTENTGSIFGTSTTADNVTTITYSEDDNASEELLGVLQNSFGFKVAEVDGNIVLSKSAGMDAGVGENVSFKPGEGETSIARLGIKLEKKLVAAKSRKVGTSISMEEAEDALVTLGLDVNDAMIDLLVTDTKNSIDRELLQEIVASCVGTQEKAAKCFSVWDATKADGLDQMGRLSTLYTQILTNSKRIQYNTKMGTGANWAIASSPASALIERMGNWKMAENDLSIDGAAIAYAGTLRNGSIKVYNDALSEDPYILMGWKGSNLTQTGVVYLPYVAPTVLSGPDTDKFGSRLMCRTRYAIVNSLFGTELFYQFMHLKNIGTDFAPYADASNRVFATI